MAHRATVEEGDFTPAWRVAAAEEEDGISDREAAVWGCEHEHQVLASGLALIRGVLLGIGMVTAPGTATVAAKTVPGRTLVVVVNGLGPQTTVKVKVKARRSTSNSSGQWQDPLDPAASRSLPSHREAPGKGRPTDRVQTVRVRKAKGAKVRVTYRTPSPTPPPPDPVTNLRLVDRTSTSIRLAWRLPEDLLEVKVERSGGTSLDPWTSSSTMPGTGSPIPV